MATETLFSVSLAVARLLGVTRRSTATGGSTSTIVDTKRGEGDDYWNEGTAWIVTDAGGSSAAPEAEFQRISDFVNSTGTFTVDTNFSAAVASGDTYEVATGKYPLDLIINSINTVLESIKIPAEDTTSLDSASNKTEYDLPAAVLTGDLRQVYIETNEDTNDNKWREIYNWEIEYGGTGSADTLITQTQLESGYDLRLVYVTRHSPVYSNSSQINEIIPKDRIIYEAAANCIISNMGMPGADPNSNEKANYFLERAEEARNNFRIKLPKKTPRLMVIHDTETEYTGTVGGVRV